MVSTLTWVLAGVVAYTILGMVLRSRGLVPEAVRFSGPLTTIHTQRGRALLERLAAPKRLWRAWGNVGVGIALVVMVGSFALFLLGAIQALRNPEPSALNQPRNALAIPGVNDFLPLSVAPEIVAGLAIGLVVHEGGHGLLCRVEDIEIDSLGLALLTVVPVGAFVQPDEENLQRADRGAQLRMFAAGVTNNFALSLLAMAVLFGPVMGSFAVVDGAPIGGAKPGSPADRAGIGAGTVIDSVEGRPISDGQDLARTLANVSGRSVTVGLADGSTTTVERALVVTGNDSGSPVNINQTIISVNGTAVYTEREFVQAAQNRSVAVLGTADGGRVTAALGAAATVARDGPLVEAGLAAGTRVVVTAVEGDRTLTGAGLQERLEAVEAGQTVELVAHVDGQRRVVSVTASDAGSAAESVGLASLEPGVNGVVFDELGVKTYPAAAFLEVLGGSPDRPTPYDSLSFPQRVFFVLVLPVAGAAGGFAGYNFPGFTGVATNFYEVEGLLGALGAEPAFLLANLLFWTGWINLVIGQFNCVPTFPLDGGHILRASTESVVSRLPVPGKRRVVTAVSVFITIVMLTSLAGMVVFPRLLT